ncbi:putative GTP-binding protein YjiA [Pandoraea horticolens]|uniref:Putative GTP-binding protein YjiA n=1 Tax=Pandoraea horticolens TaxID=2508298 RepID=A0A5E4VIR2_9BURK|nr:GTP-binding protein [Pandoraea horticolens]VVE11289.1 putative GTP-binding protein YjiA [Pandoraea horticolens]
MSAGAGHFSSLVMAQSRDDRIPVTVLTGFLGSGKTTLLNRLLALPDLHGTAVIVNEFGEVGIDNDLIANATDGTVLLSNGCMCCAMRGDLVDALARLGQRSAPPVRQVLIETSGLADPGPILRTLMGDASVRAVFSLTGVACTVDAVLGLDTLAREPEAMQQLAVADALFVTKTDLLDGPAPIALLERLRERTSQASIHGDPSGQPEALRALVRASQGTAPGDFSHVYRLGTRHTQDPAERTPIHRDGITSFVIVRDEPLPAEGFANWLDTLIAMRGKDLLRVKGIVNLVEHPDRPMIIHGVQHLFQPPELLPQWPGADRRTRMVFIARGVDAEALDVSLSVLARRRSRAGAP